jgi:glycosyltransferase involved in cell wall biosynthesis
MLRDAPPESDAVSSTAASTTQPLVSIIVPSYNQGQFLPATLKSIFDQDYRPIEVVVVDGASTDDTVSILERAAAEHPELRWISEPDDGPADAMTKGLGMISGQIAGIQSSDDVYFPGAIQAAVDGFATHPDAGIVYGDAEAIDAHGDHVSGPTRYLPFTLSRYLCGSTFIPQSSAFFRPELARQVGGVRSDYFVCDVDLWLRISFLAQPVKLPRVLSAYRHHEAQRDKQVAEILSSYRRMLAESPQIRGSSWRIRLAAWAGGRMLTQHYNPTRNPRYAAGQMWLAILAYPPSIRSVVKPRSLIPPRPRVRGVLRRLNRLGSKLRHQQRASSLDE